MLGNGKRCVRPHRLRRGPLEPRLGMPRLLQPPPSTWTQRGAETTTPPATLTHVCLRDSTGYERARVIAPGYECGPTGAGRLPHGARPAALMPLSRSDATNTAQSYTVNKAGRRFARWLARCKHYIQHARTSLLSAWASAGGSPFKRDSAAMQPVTNRTVSRSTDGFTPQLLLCWWWFLVIRNSSIQSATLQDAVSGYLTPSSMQANCDAKQQRTHTHTHIHTRARSALWSVPIGLCVVASTAGSVKPAGGGLRGAL